MDEIAKAYAEQHVRSEDVEGHPDIILDMVAEAMDELLAKDGDDGVDS